MLLWVPLSVNVLFLLFLHVFLWFNFPSREDPSAATPSSCPLDLVTCTKSMHFYPHQARMLHKQFHELTDIFCPPRITWTWWQCVFTREPGKNISEGKGHFLSKTERLLWWCTFQWIGIPTEQQNGWGASWVQHQSILCKISQSLFPAFSSGGKGPFFY